MEFQTENCGRTLTLSCFFQVAIHIIIFLTSIYILITKAFFTVNVNLGLFQTVFGLDPLTLFFFFLISILGIFVGIYSLGYLKEYQTEKHFTIFLILYNLFTISLYFVVGARDIFSFLLFWELMSVTSYFLVIFEGHKEEILKSGLMYFVMTHIGTVFIILAFLLLYKSTGSIYFGDFYKYNIDNKTLLLTLLLAFVGFGTKAGMFPFHVWLPKAHPAAPANVSGLMSGVMIKMGIYGIIRFSFNFTPRYILSFGLIILAVGCLTSVIGITHALVQRDIKTFLAYSSIENIGIILLALGISYLAFSLGFKGTGSIAFAAALLHCFNHGIFKSLLFMGAGNVLHAAGTKDIELLGGLIKRMPRTSIFFLVGALSACALPPFNGFIGEWMVYKSILQLGAQSGAIAYSTPIILSGVFLAFTGALAAYGFVKVFGIAFLGLPRSSEAKDAKEVPLSMVVPMCALSLISLITGIYPNFIMGFLNSISSSLTHEGAVAFNGFMLSLSHTGLSVLVMAVLALLIFLVTFSFMKYKEKISGTRVFETWDCGFEGLNSRMQFSGQGFIKSFNRVLSGTLVVDKNVEYTKGYLNSDGIKFDINIHDNVEKSIYTPIKQLITVIASKAQRLQQGFIQSYLAYVFIVLVLLMIFYL